MFNSILNTASSLRFEDALLCIGVSLILGFVISLAYRASGNASKNLALTLVLLPTMVQIVIMMVNGNLGAGVAVMGAFSLVRFRSLPGSSKEISAIFFAMTVGLVTGMGYLTYAVVITLILGLVLLLLSKFSFGEDPVTWKELKITIPENLDYTQVFDDLFLEYATNFTLERVRTTNLGSMFQLVYRIHLKDLNQEKKFIDQLRCRNGNLDIQCNRMEYSKEERNAL